MIVSPMLLTIAVDLGVSLEAAAAAASLYFLLYGVSQPAWGILSDRLGRIRTMRVALVGAAIAGVASAFATDLLTLTIARGLSGAFVGAVIPASLVYIGDSVPLAIRQHELAGLMAVSASATALSIVVGGAIAELSWRVGFAAIAVMCLSLAILLGRVPEARVPERTKSLVQLRRFLARPWALLVVAIALVEGAVVLGCLTYLAPAVEAGGRGPALAGLCVSLFGVGNLIAARAVRHLIERLRSGTLMMLGGGWLSAGWLCVALSQDIVSAGLASAFVGVGFALLHSTLQTWATDVAPEARATTIAFFASGLFVGSAVTALVFGPLATAGSYSTVFGIAAAVALPLALFAGVMRDRYVRQAASVPIGT